MVNEEISFSALADKEGLFSGEANLNGGKNTILATAKDAAGNKSRQSKPSTIIYDATPPNLVLLQEIPSQTADPDQTIKGKTESSAKVTINQRQVVLDNDGVFNHAVKLNIGANNLEIVATDTAGNTRKIYRSITLAGGQQATSSAESN